MYLNALSSKKLGLTKKANLAYSSLNKLIHKAESKDLIKYTWGMLMTPLIHDRRVIYRNVNNLLSLMNYYHVKPSPDILSKFYVFTKHIFHNKEVVVNYLSSLPFFKKFNDQEISKLILPLMKLQKIEKDQVAFINEGCMYYLITGDIIMKSHKHRIFPSKLLANYKEGDIIGDLNATEK